MIDKRPRTVVCGAVCGVYRVTSHELFVFRGRQSQLYRGFSQWWASLSYPTY